MPTLELDGSVIVSAYDRAAGTRARTAAKSAIRRSRRRPSPLARSGASFRGAIRRALVVRLELNTSSLQARQGAGNHDSRPNSVVTDRRYRAGQAGIAGA